MSAAVLYVKDLERMRSFYETCLAMTARQSQGNDFCVLGSDGWELTLVRGQRRLLRDEHDVRRPERTLGEEGDRPAVSLIGDGRAA